MNGQLSEQPLAELIREISAKSLGGRLRLEHDRVHVVVYFENGNIDYAASNLRTLRLREYLRKSELVSEDNLDERVPDLELLKQLCARNLLSAAAAEQVQTKQVADVLHLALLWTDGAWEFESRSRLEEKLNLKLDVDSLLLEAARRLPAEFVVSRFSNNAEVITPVTDPLVNNNLLPAEVFLLSRLDQPMSLRELVAISGIGEQETLQLVYSLALTGVVQREHWKSVLRDQKPPPPPRRVEPVATPATPPVEREQPREIELADVESFLARVKTAQTHYDVLGVNREVSTESLKTIYYQLARSYHPDRFRKSHASLVTRLEAAFARIKQAYDTLRDDNLRANYNTKIATARKKAEQVVTEPAPQAPTPQPGAVVEKVAESAAERAARGQMLAGNEKTRRAAEAELLAAIKLDPKNAEYRVMLAELYRDLGLKLRAKGEAERAVAADPNNRKARDLLRELKSV
jgi:tetratricopeptide (TPR) repeat protein